MKTKELCFAMAFFMLFAFSAPPVHAYGMKEAGASLLVPTSGQAMNDQLGNTKTKIMGAVEVASITTVAILGGIVGGPVIWAGLGPLIANHAWSSVDAYRGAQTKMRSQAYSQQQIMAAQQTLEASRDNRYDREQVLRSDVRARVAQAGEMAYR